MESDDFFIKQINGEGTSAGYLYDNLFFLVQTSIYAHENAIAAIQIGVLFSRGTPLKSLDPERVTIRDAPFIVK